MAGGKIPRTCENCGIQFFTYPYNIKIGKARFCSPACRQSADRVSRVESQCKACGKTLLTRPTDAGRRGTTCNATCRSVANRVPLARRFWAKVLRTEGCWLWQGAINSNGYGTVRANGRNQAAHRVSYELTYGPMPAGLLGCHKCDNRQCVRPDHIFPGTHQDNMQDCVQKERNATKLTANDVREIRRLRQAGVRPMVLAAQFHTDYTNIYLIVKRKAWAHVE